ncbi:hypothetical protein GCK72_016300 [Caenorhabditis remanei]|uniref:Uncharacterized protein n=1 Tax=Caenorhabditis remanei TaxID=31234 RepID=A0A6A5GZK2_CAERE|nr:hypothetical protein GCK72_016300 [Caenorhabditis remanei]KAF1759833.1 hypothetical protein GCK72_016300 [Caenorhabditis remanei]
MSSTSRPSSGSNSGAAGGGAGSGGGGGGSGGGGGGGIRGFFSKLRKPSDQVNGSQIPYSLETSSFEMSRSPFMTSP